MRHSQKETFAATQISFRTILFHLLT